MKSPLYLTENLLGGQFPRVLWHWLVNLLSQKEEEIYIQKMRAVVTSPHTKDKRRFQVLGGCSCPLKDD